MSEAGQDWKYTAVFLTAMDNELESVLSLLIDVERGLRGTESKYLYFSGRFVETPPGDGRSAWRVLARKSGRGQLAAQKATEAAARDWSPDALLYLGCAGGRPDWMSHAQVVVANQVFYYESARVGRGSVRTWPQTGAPDPHLLEAAEQSLIQVPGSPRTWMERLCRCPSANRYFPNDVITRLSGVSEALASGEKIVTAADGSTWKTIQAAHYGVAGTETEGMGFLSADCGRADGTSTPRLMIRGISDLLGDKDAGATARPAWTGDFSGDDLQRLATTAAGALALDTLVRFEATIAEERNETPVSHTVDLHLAGSDPEKLDACLMEFLKSVRRFGVGFTIMEKRPGSLIATLSVDTSALALLRALEAAGLLSRIAGTETTILSGSSAEGLDVPDDISELAGAIRELGAEDAKTREAAAARLEALAKKRPDWPAAVAGVLDKAELPSRFIWVKGQAELNALRPSTRRLRLLCRGDVADLTPLSGLSNLTSLDISRCAGVTDLTPLSGLSNLTSLFISGCVGVTDLTPLKGLPNLTSLDISGCAGVTDLTPLSGLSKLIWLDLSGCERVVDLGALSGLVKLRYLSLPDGIKISGKRASAYARALGDKSGERVRALWKKWKRK